MRKKLIISFDDLYLFVLVALECKIFYLIELPGTLGAVANTILVIIGSIGIFFIYIVRTGYLYDGSLLFSRYIVLVFLLLFIEWLYTVNKYPGQSMADSLKELLPFITLLSYFFLAHMAKIDFVSTVKFLIRCSSVLALFFIIHAFIYNTYGSSFLKIYSFNYGEIRLMVRNMGIRLIGTYLIDYMAYLSIGMLFFVKTPREDKKIYIVNIILVSIYTFYVSQTRSSIAMLLITIFIFFMFTENRNLLLKITMILLAVFVFFIVCSQIIEMLHTWNTDWSLYHRIDAIQYYWHQFINSPVCGIGLLRDNSSMYYNIIHGNAGYALSDVGLIGQLGHFGLFGLLMYYMYFKTCIKSIFVDGIRNTVSIAVIIASGLSLINLSLFDAGRIFEMAVFMAMIDGSVNYIKKNII